jgi:magnesium transporter
MAKKEQTICDGTRWIDITNPSREEMDDLSKEFGLNHQLVRDCMQPEHLPKYEFSENVHFLILRFMGPKKANDRLLTIQSLTHKIATFYADHFIITIHRSEVPFLDSLYEKSLGGNKCITATALLAQVVWKALETFDEPVNKLSDRVDLYENKVIHKRPGGNPIETLYGVKRQASIGHKVLMLMQEPINHIYIKKGEETALQDVRDQHLKMLTLYNQVLDDVNNLFNLSMSLASKRTNDVMKVLTIFSVFFMPLTFIVGVYGMNFQYMPELTKKWGYPAVMVLMSIITVIIYIWFKRKKWL